MSDRLLREADIIAAMLENKKMFRTDKDIQRFAVIVGSIPAVDVDLNFKLAYERGKSDRPQGEWIHDYHFGLALPEHKCSVCGEWEYSDTESNYCPNCGARMVSK